MIGWNAIVVCRKKNRARARCTWSVCSRLRLLHVQVRRVTDRWLTIAYRLNSMTNNVVSLFTAPFTARTIVRRVTDQWLAIDKSTTSYPNEVFIIHAIRVGDSISRYDPHTVGKSMKRPFHWCTGEGRTTCKSGIIRSQSLSFVLRLNLYS